MNGTTVKKSISAQTTMSLYFLFVLILVLTLLGNKVESVRITAYVLIAVCLMGMYRASRCGFVSIEPCQLVVRTLLRTRKFRREEIQSIEPETISQVTLRVMPVLTLRDGRRYKLAEFFMQKKRYEKSIENNKITDLVTTVMTWIRQT